MRNAHTDARTHARTCAGALQERLAEVKLDVKAMAFSADGAHLALGAEDGTLLVLEWPGMKPKLSLAGWVGR